MLVCPVGFVSDHLEIRWDLDTEAAERPHELGIGSTGSRCRTTIRRSSACSPPSSVGRSRYRRPHEAGRDRVDAGEPALPRLPAAGADAEGAGAPPRRNRGAAEVWALRDVSLAVEPGEAVGLIGRNGSGKTTLLSLVAGIIKPTSGRVDVGGRVASLLELGAGFHPDFTGRENVYLNGVHLRPQARCDRRRLDEIVAFAELERFIDIPVRTYSSGMYMRLGFAVAAHIEADVLLLDEVFAVGDEEFQRKCFGKIFEYKQRGGTIVFVSHDAASVERLCWRAVLLRDGRVELDGSTQEAIARYHKLLADERDPAEGARRPARVRKRRGAHRRGAPARP